MHTYNIVSCILAWLITTAYFLLEQDIDVSSLALLTEDMIKEIIPMVGHRAKFKCNLEEWKKALTVTNEVTILVRKN